MPGGPFARDAVPCGPKPRRTLVVDLKTAKALGRTIPPSVVERADQIIQ